MVRRLIGEFRLKSGAKIYVPPHVENIDAKTNWEDINIYTVDTVQSYAVGTLLKIGTKTWAYAEFGGTTAAGDLLQAEVPAAAHDALAAVAGSAGDTTITITSPASGSDDFIANEYAGGQMLAMVNGSPGYSYDILSHPALDISAVATMVVTLLPGWGTAVAVAATDDFSFTKSPFKEVIIHPAVQTAQICGVSMGIGADGSFGWLGVEGPHPVLTEGTVIIGYEVRPGETTNGTVTPLVYDEDINADQGSVGVCMDVGGNGEFSLININIGLGF